MVQHIYKEEEKMAKMNTQSTITPEQANINDVLARAQAAKLLFDTAQTLKNFYFPKVESAIDSMSKSGGHEVTIEIAMPLGSLEVGAAKMAAGYIADVLRAQRFQANVQDTGYNAKLTVSWYEQKK
jgi:hypothetical protein